MGLSRRGVMLGLSCVAAGGPALAQDDIDDFQGLERKYGGRLGVFVHDTGSDRSQSYREDEHFLMCSTFKVLAVADVLARVDAGREQLDRRIPYGQKDLLDYAPVTRAHLKDGGMVLGALCAAAIHVSDNTAANLILSALGGPAEVTRFARSLGDDYTRLDRTEPTLNDPGGELDTTTPRAMSRSVGKILLGQVLKPASRDRLEKWMQEETPGLGRVRRGLPSTWTAADKPGTGDTQTNDVVLARRPDGKSPLMIAAYYENPKGNSVQAQAVMQAIGRIVGRWAT
ncbi:MAG TPA: class A beta-lactamase [Caulobacteraceae bacterium]|jgi:beta-lactamase class A